MKLILESTEKGYNLEFKSDSLELSAITHTLPRVRELIDIVLNTQKS